MNNYLIDKDMDPKIREKLEEVFKLVHTCSICEKQYGGDNKKDNKICPICKFKFFSKKNKNRMSLPSGKKHLNN